MFKAKTKVYYFYYLYKNDCLWIESVNEIVHLGLTFNVDIIFLANADQNLNMRNQTEGNMNTDVWGSNKSVANYHCSRDIYYLRLTNLNQ